MKNIPVINGNPITQEQIDSRTSVFICWDCGTQFLTKEQIKRDGVVTAHLSTCGLCQKHKSVTHMRHWNYLKLPIK